ncbi:MAG: Gfo/Idh/MocA family protein [Armatimonadota bacterium]|jgi:predicted dehydrogenase|nr:Gfo/Idh/MocA family oxidoreductase [Acidobacteriota bacterium]
MKSLRWGLIAAGNIAARFAKGLATTTEADVVAVGARSRDRATQFARAHGIERAYGSYAEVLADPDVDAVYISTPNHLHAEWAIAAARAGKHILCEKPAALNAPQLEAVLDVVQACDVFFMEAFMYRCHPQWERVREVMASGAIGETRIIEAAFSFNFGCPLDNIRMSRSMGGGSLMDVGCYCLSFARMVAGEEPRECKATARIGPDSEVDEWAAGVLAFPSGAIAHFACGMRCATPVRAAVYGDRGYLSVASPWLPDADGATVTVVSEGREETHEVSHGLDLYAGEALTVAAHLGERQAPAMTWSDSLGQARAMDALRASIGLVFPGDCSQ